MGYIFEMKVQETLNYNLPHYNDIFAHQVQNKQMTTF